LRSDLSVWHVAREYAGLAEAGGVKDVVRGLAEAQARAGLRTTVVLPFYGFLPEALHAGPVVASVALSLPDQDRGNAFSRETARVIAHVRQGVRVMLVDLPRYSAARDVYTYTALDEEENRWKTRGSGHWDAHQKNVALQRVALECALALGEVPAVFHCHDGHTAFLPALLREDERYRADLARSRAVVTIHNAGPGYHQEVWSAEFARLLTGLPERVLRKGILGTVVDPLLLAGCYASLATVSERYAEELLSENDGELSGGLGRALRERAIALHGITNGIDPGPWDPRSAPGPDLPFPFDPLTGDLAGKRKSRERLLSVLGLPDRGGPLYAFVGRLTGQKGIDVLIPALEQLLPSDGRRAFIVLGRGDKQMEEKMAALASTHAPAGRFAFVPRYDEELASLIYSSSDFFLVPSAFEPCGLTDYIAQLRGSIPVVHRVGGLVKVRDGETGFSYDEHQPHALAAAVNRTTRLFRDEPGLLDGIRRRAFDEIFRLHTWDRVLAESYLPFYEAALPGTEWTRGST
jgi:starch synthase